MDPAGRRCCSTAVTDEGTEAVLILLERDQYLNQPKTKLQTDMEDVIIYQQCNNRSQRLHGINGRVRLWMKTASLDSMSF